MANLNIRRRSGFIQRGGVSRRETLWIEISTVEATLGGAPTAVLANSLNAAALALRPFTVVRTRGIFFARSDQNIAGETYMADLGLCVVSDQAAAIGVTAVPTPATDKGSDLFFVYEQLISRHFFGTSVGVNEQGISKQFDSKAMRKVNDDQDLVLVLENEINGVVTATSGRLLIKLH